MKSLPLRSPSFGLTSLAVLKTSSVASEFCTTRMRFGSKQNMSVSAPWQLKNYTFNGGTFFFSIMLHTVCSECHRNTWQLVCHLLFNFHTHIITKYNQYLNNEWKTYHLDHLHWNRHLPLRSLKCHQLPQNFVLQGWDFEASKICQYQHHDN